MENNYKILGIVLLTVFIYRYIITIFDILAECLYLAIYILKAKLNITSLEYEQAIAEMAEDKTQKARKKVTGFRKDENEEVDLDE